jgi:hypothetical protein
VLLAIPRSLAISLIPTPSLLVETSFRISKALLTDGAKYPLLIVHHIELRISLQASEDSCQQDSGFAMESWVEHVARLYETDFLLDKKGPPDMMMTKSVHLNEPHSVSLTNGRRPLWI